MANVKNLFVGCPVTVKGCDQEVKFVETLCIEEQDVYLFNNGWFKAHELKLAPFPDPDAIARHLERFPKST